MFLFRARREKCVEVAREADLAHGGMPRRHGAVDTRPAHRSVHGFAGTVELFHEFAAVFVNRGVTHGRVLGDAVKAFCPVSGACVALFLGLAQFPVHVPSLLCASLRIFGLTGMT
jgi:hypothetical protein